MTVLIADFITRFVISALNSILLPVQVVNDMTKRYTITNDNRIYDNYLSIYLSVSISNRDAKVIVDLLNEKEEIIESYKVR